MRECQNRICPMKDTRQKEMVGPIGAVTMCENSVAKALDTRQKEMKGPTGAK